MNELSELTCGSLGRWTRYRWCLRASLGPDAFSLRTQWLPPPFRRAVEIPTSSITKVVSEKHFLLLGSSLRVIHGHPGAPELVRFISTDWARWLDAFAARGIAVEDPLDLRHADTRWLRLAKKVNLAAAGVGMACAALGAAAALLAVLAAVFSSTRH